MTVSHHVGGCEERVAIGYRDIHPCGHPVSGTMSLTVNGTQRDVPLCKRHITMWRKRAEKAQARTKETP